MPKPRVGRMRSDAVKVPRLHIPRFSKKQIEAILRRNDLKKLYIVPSSVAIYSGDPEWAASICRKLASHSNPAVRGNAIVGSATLAQRFREIDRRSVRVLIRIGRRDRHAWVRASAADANQILQGSVAWPKQDSRK